MDGAAILPGTALIRGGSVNNEAACNIYFRKLKMLPTPLSVSGFWVERWRDLGSWVILFLIEI